jgi:hypothetical protein
LVTTSTRKKKEQGRPSALRIALRRSRRFARPALYGVLILCGFGAIAYGIAMVDPAGQARRMLDQVAMIGPDRSMTVQAGIVDGRQNTPLPLIREALGVSRGDSMLEFSPEAARQRLESIPWVARAHVERHLPGTIVLRLEERRPFAIWQNQGRFVIVDREGSEIRFSNETGLSYSNSFQGEFSFNLLKNWDMRFAYKYLDVKAKYGGEIQQQAMIPRNRALFNTGYKSRNKRWEYNLTVSVIGQSLYLQLCRRHFSNYDSIVGLLVWATSLF